MYIFNSNTDIPMKSVLILGICFPSYKSKVCEKVFKLWLNYTISITDNIENLLNFLRILRRKSFFNESLYMYFFQKCVSEYIRNNKYQQSTFFEPGRDRENINVR